MTTRDFHLGDVLSITTMRMLSPRGMDGIRDILEFMTGSVGMTDSGSLLCADICARALIEQHPTLADIKDDDGDLLPAGWLDGHVAQLGEKLTVRPIREPTGEPAAPWTEHRNCSKASGDKS